MPATQPPYVDATFYAVITPQWNSWQEDEKGRPILKGAKVERITQTRPGTVKGGGVVTRLTLRLDAEALLPLEPQAIIRISPGEVDVIEVTAEDPSELIVCTECEGAGCDECNHVGEWRQ